MRLDRSTHRRIRLQNALYTALVLVAAGLLAWLSQLFAYSADWTANARHSLSAETEEIIDLVEGPVAITAYLGPEPQTRRAVETLVERYRDAGLDIDFRFVNPETEPGLARELQLKPGGEVMVEIDGRRERLDSFGEAELTQALARLSRERDRFIVFTQGHGERDPVDDADRGYADLGEQLGDRGVHFQTIDLARNPSVPNNADLLVIAGPRSDYLPGEYAAIQRYLDAGRNLLWLTDPGEVDRFDELADMLGVEALPGVVVAPEEAGHDAATPDFARVSDYGDSAITRGLDGTTVFPRAAALTTAGDGPDFEPLLRTRDGSWNETGQIAGNMEPDADAERRGPHAIGLAARRDGGNGEQRLAVVGDSDFLANAYVGSGANLEFGVRLLNWLVGDDERVAITPARPDDIKLDISGFALGIMGAGLLFALPLALLSAGLVVWWRRQKR